MLSVALAVVDVLVEDELSLDDAVWSVGGGPGGGGGGPMPFKAMPSELELLALLVLVSLDELLPRDWRASSRFCSSDDSCWKGLAVSEAEEEADVEDDESLDALVEVKSADMKSTDDPWFCWLL